MRELDLVSAELSGINLIEASAGTGKTYAITSLYLRLVLERGLTPEQILVVTYTEAATQELRGRIRTRLRDALRVLNGGETEDHFMQQVFRDDLNTERHKSMRLKMEKALALFDTAAIFTIHGFCMRALQDNAFESGAAFDAELVTDQNRLLQEIVDDFWRHRFFGDSADLLQYALQQEYSPAMLAGFAKNIINNGTVTIRPLVSGDDLASLEHTCRNDFVTLCVQWQECKSDVMEIFKNDKGLSKSVDNYHPKLIPVLFEAMDTYCENGNPFALFENFEKFCSSGVTAGTKKTGCVPQHQLFDSCQKVYDSVTTRMLYLRSELATYCNNELTLRKQQQGIRFFDDLLVELHAGLSGENGGILSASLRDTYRATLIDEFQDTDPLQYDIFRRIYEGYKAPLFLIGDPKQAIYSFRGADIFAYMSAAAQVSDDKQFTLSGNWRSTPQLLDAYNTLFTHTSHPFLFDQISYHTVFSANNNKTQTDAVNSPLQIWLAPVGADGKPMGVAEANTTISRCVAAEISRLLQNHLSPHIDQETRVVPADIAVIVRSHRQAGIVQKALQDLCIPCVMRSDASVFASDEAVELHTLLLALAEPGNEAKIRTALVTDLLGYRGDDLLSLLPDEQNGEGWLNLLEEFHHYHNTWQEKGFMTAMRQLMSHHRVRGRMLCYSNGERRLTNILHCCELIHDMCHGSTLGIDGLVAWFGDRISSYDTGEANQIRLETDEQAIKIVTVHVSKGLEYPIVFCPFLWIGIRDYDDVISYHEGFSLVKDFGSPVYGEKRKQAHKEALAENLRLLYVALTRAKQRCYLVAGKIVDKSYDRKKQSRPQTSPLAYLLHSGDDVLSADDCVEALGSKVSQLTAEEMASQLKQVFAAETPSADVVPMPDETASGVPDVLCDGRQSLVCRTFGRVMDNDWRVTSFTGLSAHETPVSEAAGRDESSRQTVITDLRSELSMHTFPRGPQPGVCLHEIFEGLDFSGGDQGQIDALTVQALQKYGYGEHWLPTVSAMVRDVLSTPLSSPDGEFTLAGIRPGSWITEMEFFFPLSFVTSERVKAILHKYSNLSDKLQLDHCAKALNFQPVRGMLRGFMDMVFESGGRYYLLDWKSNHLGYTQQDYSRDTLSLAMEQNLYVLQYLLYLVALNRYLSVRVNGYTYASHFGGVVYVFLRGVNAAAGEQYGFYRDLPSCALIDELTNCLVDCGDLQS